MATDQQVALKRSHRIPSTSSHISKAARQVVPAFLQKLYEMVNDPNNADLIRWSETGDSFFVLDQDRFAHDVLGSWFKHRNFSSFVRQLNMYGFHKIPHLQQGVLKSDSDTEFWNFAHANFHRGQPDLLCLIQRKKQAAQQGDEPTIELQHGTNGVGLIGAPSSTAGVTPAKTATLSNGQILDINSIVSGINAIKRHQTTISAEMNELKRSNQLLWQDARSIRTTYQKQQDTINRIVKFLAGVFGNHPAAAGVGAQSVGAGQGNQDGADDATNGSRRRMRLMIEDAKRDGPTKSMIEELSEIPIELDAVMQYADTPLSVPLPTPAVDNSSVHLDSNGETPNEHSTVSPQQAETLSAETQPQEQKQQEQQGNQISRAVTPNRSPTFEFDPRFHSMLTQLSPSQLQLLLATLATQTLTDPPPSAPAETVNPNATSLTQYQPPFDFSQMNPAFNQLPNVDGLISFDNYEPQLPADVTQPVLPSEQQQEHEKRMEQQQRAAEEIDKDVSAMDTSINTLIQTLGMDPADFGGIEPNSSEMNETTSAFDPSHAPTTTTTDFDFDSFFNILPNGLSSPGPTVQLDSSNPGIDSVGMDRGVGFDDSSMGDLASTSFLDEAHTPAPSSLGITTSPMRQDSPEVMMTANSDTGTEPETGNLPMSDSGTAPLKSHITGKGAAAAGKKRKSEGVIDFHPGMVLSDTTTTKDGSGGKKRRKDR